MTLRSPLALALAGLFTTASANADETLAGKACRSVHLQYRAGTGTAFVNSVTVDRSAPGTYFCVGGFGHGYLGIQELGNSKKLIIFSVWDPGKQDDPNAVDPEKRVKLMDKGPDTRIGRFGNEGTGGQSFVDLDWKDGATYTFLLTAAVQGDRSIYTAYYADPEGGKTWKLIASFSTLAKGDLLKGYYAFIEDFRRNKVSATQEREARFGPAWVREADSVKWKPVTAATFTSDRNPSLAIDAGLRDGRFFLATGGKTANDHTKLKERIELPAVDPAERDALPAEYPPLP